MFRGICPAVEDSATIFGRTTMVVDAIRRQTYSLSVWISVKSVRTEI